MRDINGVRSEKCPRSTDAETGGILIQSNVLRRAAFCAGSALLLLLPCSTNAAQNAVHECVSRTLLDRESFLSVMQTVAESWNRGDARTAASCFAEDATYSAPPSPPHRGRKALYEYFGGTKGREIPMHMTWHNLIFDPAQQIGVGEYTFKYRMQTHGLVIVRMSKGLILNWREYEVQSALPWDQFVAENRF